MGFLEELPRVSVCRGEEQGKWCIVLFQVDVVCIGRRDERPIVVLKRSQNQIEEICDPRTGHYCRLVLGNLKYCTGLYYAIIYVGISISYGSIYRHIFYYDTLILMICPLARRYPGR